jgi:hypothetical protein
MKSGSFKIKAFGNNDIKDKDRYDALNHLKAISLNNMSQIVN